jgi:predicted TIM-barrel fold metal-dependent hydrolase
VTEPAIIRFLIARAIEAGLPLQVHTGFGDADLNLHEADPLLLTPLLRELEPTGVPVLLLHTYPFQRHAGYLAQVFDNVFCDVGLAIPHTGRRAHVVLAELLELAPYGKVLYSSDAFGLPELYYLGAVLFRRALSRVLEELELPPGEAERIAHLIAQGNAERAYHRVEL